MSTRTGDGTRAQDAPATPQRLRRLPSRLLGLAAIHADRLVSDGLATAESRKWHYAVLAALQESGPTSQATLSRTTGIYRSDLVTVIDELVGRGFVERVPDPADRRRNVVSVTPDGRRQLRRLDKLLAVAQDDLLAPLSQADRGVLTDLLARVVDHHASRNAADRWTK